MKKISLTESDLLKIVNKVLNEQYYRQLDEDEIDLLNFIFERELKPPFSAGEINERTYYNQNNESVGWIYFDNILHMDSESLSDIKHKVCQVFKFSYDTVVWWYVIKPHLKSWMEDQLNTKLRDVR